MINKDNFSKNNKQNKFLYLFFCFIIFILIFSTGFFSDDFSEFSNIKDTEYVFSYLPSKIFINIPVLYYTHYIFYYLISIENFILISLIKFVYTLLSFYMVTKFFSIHTNYHNSLHKIVVVHQVNLHQGQNLNHRCRNEKFRTNLSKLC